MTLFNKIMKSQQKQKEQELNYKIISIADEVEEMFIDKQVTIYEGMDIFKELTTRLNFKIVQIMEDRAKIIQDLSKKNVKEPANNLEGEVKG